MLDKNQTLKAFVYLICFLFIFQTLPVLAINHQDALEQQFQSPPYSAKPRVFWWWLESNVSKEGITRDLEEMQDKGIGGALIFDAGSSSYNIAQRTPAGPQFLSDEWLKLYKHALAEADRLGLELGLNVQSGWNLGGPMVTPEFAMKKMLFSEIHVTGPGRQILQLPLPESIVQDYYRDVCVLAFPKHDIERKPIFEWARKSVNDRFRGGGNYPLYLLRQEYPSVPGEQDLNSKDIIRLDEYINASGSLSWDVPEGEWTILRMGYSITGAKVSTSSPGWNGLAIEYLSTDALDFYYDQVVDKLIDTAGEYAGKSLKYLHSDSWEMGWVSWTADFPAQFKRFRGYDIWPYMPILAKKIVNNREITNRFLYDVRRTIADCIAENHYRKFAEYAHENGLMVHPESGGPHSAPIDALQCLGTNDMPMGEFWARSETHRTIDEHRLFGKQPASAAHIYGKTYVAAEGFTSIGPQWERDPWALKPVADREFCEGINRIYYHEFTASQLDAGVPGNEYFAGTHYNPDITWWKQSKAFNDYLSRSQLLLQQGLFVADVCYYYGNSVPNFVPLKAIDPSLGPGYDYDMVNTEVILNRMSVQDGRIVLPDGMSYKVLVLPELTTMRLDVLKKIMQMVRDGAIITGPRPTSTPGLLNYPECDTELNSLADSLWGQCDGQKIKMHHFGKGRIYLNTTLKEILGQNGMFPDFEYKSRHEGTLLDFIHRKVNDTDIYFVINRNNHWTESQCTFRINDRIPESWCPDSGEIQDVPLYQESKGRTTLPLRLPPYGSVFITFRKQAENHNHLISVERNGLDLFAEIGETIPENPAAEIIKNANNSYELIVRKSGTYTLLNNAEQSIHIEIDTIPETMVLDGPWKLSFPQGWGAPESVTIDKLKSWPSFTEPGIKYFSGTAVYQLEFLVPENLNQVKSVLLDLGKVKNIAGVRLNGKNFETLWKRPFRTDISKSIKTGMNTLEVEITNMWPNRLIGDQFLPEKDRYTRTNILKFTKETPLQESGLFGPVTLHFAQSVNIQFTE